MPDAAKAAEAAAKELLEDALRLILAEAVASGPPGPPAPAPGKPARMQQRSVTAQPGTPSPVAGRNTGMFQTAAHWTVEFPRQMTSPAACL